MGIWRCEIKGVVEEERAMEEDGVGVGHAITVPLVLDVKKCHFRYAILLLEESLKLQQQCPKMLCMMYA